MRRSEQADEAPRRSRRGRSPETDDPISAEETDVDEGPTRVARRGKVVQEPFKVCRHARGGLDLEKVQRKITDPSSWLCTGTGIQARGGGRAGAAYIGHVDSKDHSCSLLSLFLVGCGSAAPHKVYSPP